MQVIIKIQNTKNSENKNIQHHINNIFVNKFEIDNYVFHTSSLDPFKQNNGASIKEKQQVKLSVKATLSPFLNQNKGIDFIRDSALQCTALHYEILLDSKECIVGSFCVYEYEERQISSELRTADFVLKNVDKIAFINEITNSDINIKSKKKDKPNLNINKL